MYTQDYTELIYIYVNPYIDQCFVDSAEFISNTLVESLPHPVKSTGVLNSSVNVSVSACVRPPKFICVISHFVVFVLFVVIWGVCVHVCLLCSVKERLSCV